VKNIKVLGSGCAKCTKTAEVIANLAYELNIPADVEKVTDAQVIMAYGVMSTPAVVVDEQLVHSGSVPSREEMTKWFTGA